MDTHVEVFHGGRLVMAQLLPAQAVALAFTPRDSITGPKDYCYAMRHARERFRTETVTRNGASFRAWAKRTYNPAACWGKLHEVVSA